MTTKSDVRPSGQPLRGSSIDDVMPQSALGKWFEKNKTTTILGIVAISALIVAFGLYNQNSKEESNQASNSLYHFKAGTLASYKDKKTSVEDVLAKFKVVAGEVGKFSGLLITGLELSDLFQGGGHQKEALEVLDVLSKNGLVDKGYAGMFVGIRKAALLEDLDKVDEAVVELEQLLQANQSTLKDKIYFDLGRLYKKQGKLDKARTNFQYVIDNFTGTSEFAKVSKLYLENLGDK